MSVSLKTADLPTWDLSDLYRGPSDPAIDADFAWATAEAAALVAVAQGKLNGMASADFAATVKRYEALDERLGKLGSFAQLLYAQDMSSPDVGRFYQSVQERITEIAGTLLFFTLELNQLDPEAVEALLADPAAARYRPWVEASRAFRPHQLSDTEEKLLLEKSLTGRAAWVRLFDETMAALRIPIDGRELTSTEVLALMVSPDREMRKASSQAFGKALADEVRVFSLITNTLAKDKEVEDRWRKYPRPISSRNLGNRVEDGVVDALIAAVRSAYPRLAHRYYKLKAQWLGLKQLETWDRNAPLPGAPDRQIPWREATETVLSAYHAFSPDLATVARQFFDKAWIDAPVRPGKAPGAFAHPTVPSAHPYLLVNYQGKVRDVMTLAHELGHGVHQVLAGKTQGHLLAETPLTLAETASVFGEMLTFRALLAQEKDPAQRRFLLASKVEDMLNTVVRQIALHSFEEAVHDRRRQGELLPDDLAEIWLHTQRDCLGDAVRFDDSYKHFWAYIPHFIHSPFYVYAYAYGDCLVNSLYAVYAGAEEGFAERYLTLLKAGGSQHHSALLAPFGLDARDPAFWDRGLQMIADFIDELESLPAHV
ncbi:oligoendopeptidase F [Elstera cyanobacteriorum]|uniref:Oligoendopeptidase F n=1 Tax=Elstera cyanobacteriorum TaxID=2022747 RepID=A0A255XKT4_9PROT|nr:M3 family oligoendopeptidase [Elstera cyanobacteriorum]OYQ16984.1 oligoendopeptidase F [Elstera cyanobacteriorum]GFZ89942.1 oligoendopeptidase F [Elstera cyanobacteriorum]